jgi:hypothetical protein
VPGGEEHDIEVYLQARDRWLELSDQRARWSAQFQDQGRLDEAIEAALADYRFSAEAAWKRRRPHA